MRLPSRLVILFRSPFYLFLVLAQALHRRKDASEQEVISFLRAASLFAPFFLRGARSLLFFASAFEQKGENIQGFTQEETGRSCPPTTLYGPQSPSSAAEGPLHE